MKPVLCLFSLLLGLTACTPGPDQAPRPQPSASAENPTPQLVQLYVNSEEVDCMGVGPRKCLQTRQDPAADWELFYAQIEGFDFEPGFIYLLEVETREVKNPPADASSIHYQLKRIVSKENS